MGRKTKAATQTGIYLAIVAAILVVANVISFGAYKRVDMTRTSAPRSPRAPPGWCARASTKSSRPTST